jgi:peptidyl-prolyl cis-trans isomerase SurA
MGERVWIDRALCAAAAFCCFGCQQLRPSTPPPDVRRPEIKSEAQLAAEREERIRSGAVVPTSSPVILNAERAAAATRRAAAALEPTPGAIEADILLINDTALTVPEVLFPLRGYLEQLRTARTHAGFLEDARRAIRRSAQEAIGTILMYAEATAKLDDEQKKQIDAAVDKEVENLTARDYGGSLSRLKARLKDSGLTKEQWRENLKRDLVVRQYTRETLMPQVQIRRDELLAEYQRNLARYTTPPTRELLLIELPFEKFLADGRTWDRATPADRAQAKLKALRRAREAQAALAERPFEDVAREYSLGLHADEGGSWGPIGRPLQPPYDVVSKPVFEWAEGQVGAPVETDRGWYIAKCGHIEPVQQRPFVKVQEEIRADLMERRFQKLSMDAVLKLAEKATISSLDAFVTAAVDEADKRTATASRDTSHP